MFFDLDILKSKFKEEIAVHRKQILHDKAALWNGEGENGFEKYKIKLQRFHHTYKHEFFFDLFQFLFGFFDVLFRFIDQLFQIVHFIFFGFDDLQLLISLFFKCSDVLFRFLWETIDIFISFSIDKNWVKKSI